MNHTVKQLLVERTYAEAAVAGAKNETAIANEKLRNAQEYRKQINQEIAKAQNATPDQPAISDRALLDYIELHLGFNLERVIEMIQEDLKQAKIQATIDDDNIVLAIRP